MLDYVTLYATDSAALVPKSSHRLEFRSRRRVGGRLQPGLAAARGSVAISIYLPLDIYIYIYI